VTNYYEHIVIYQLLFLPMVFTRTHTHTHTLIVLGFHTLTSSKDYQYLTSRIFALHL